MLAKIVEDNKQFISFIFLNGLAAIANFSSRIIFSSVVSYSYAIILAYGVGMVTAYLLCRFFIFRPAVNRTHIQIFYFTIVNVFALLQTLIISLLFAHYLLRDLDNQSLQEAIGHFIGLCAPVVTSYFGHKYITFR